MPPPKEAPPPLPPPAGGVSLAVILCAKLFPTYAPIAHHMVARLAALGWTEDRIATYLRTASKDPSLAPSVTAHPLHTAVWRAEHRFRQPPGEAPPVPHETAPPSAPAPPQHVDAPPPPPLLQSKIDEARATLEAAHRKVGLKRRRIPNDPPDGEGGDRGDGGS